MACMGSAAGDRPSCSTSEVQTHRVSDSAPNPPTGGCCVDCGSGRTACDDGCIRKIAAIECRATCGNQPRNIPPLDLDECPEKCCRDAGSSATVNKKPVPESTSRNREDACHSRRTNIQGPSDITAKKKEPCGSTGSITACGGGKPNRGAPCSGGRKTKSINKRDGESCGSGCQIDTASEKDTCCANKPGLHNSAQEDDSCCASKPATGCSEKKDSCCAKEADACCAEKEDTYYTEKQDACCAKKEDACSAKEADSCCAQEDTCCAKKEDTCYAEKEDACCAEQEDTCCTGKKEALISQAPIDGCKQGSSCCDISTSSKAKDLSPAPYEGKRQQTTVDTCIHHLQKAFAEYSSYIEKGRCICRSVLDRLDTCCGEVVPKKAITDDLTSSFGKSTALASTQQLPVRRQASRACGKSCCDKTAQRNKAEVQSCSLDKVEISSDWSRKSINVRTKEVDVEDAAAREHVLLSVAGMTCTGCSRKVSNVLKNIDGLSSIKVTFVTALVEFDLNTSITNLEQLIPPMEKETGFKFSRIISNFQSLDLRIDRTTATHAKEDLEALSESVEQLDKFTFRVNYDPTIIGARKLLSSIRGASLVPPQNDAKTADGRRRLVKMAWFTALATVLTIPVVVLAWAHTPVPYTTRSIISLVLASLVQGLAVPEFYAGAMKSLIYSRVLEMDMLIVISITAAYVYSVVAFSLTHAGFTLEIGEFFETSSLLITFVLLGRLVAAMAKVKAVSAVSLRSLQAEKALLVESPQETIEIDSRLLQLGDDFVIPAHSRIVTDGYVIHGQSSVDESMITGESVPIPKASGDKVIAGTVNGPSPLTIRLTRLPGKNSITDIVNLVENALASKPRIQDLADKVAGYFIPVVISIALVTFAIWMAIAVKLRGKDTGGALGLAITYGIAVLAVSCPCALGLAVPMVLVIAGGVAARSGVIIKQANAIEKSYKVTDVVFDKTGTLTEADLAVIHEQVFPNPDATQDEVFAVTKALTKDIQHPVSLAVVNHIKGTSTTPTDIKQVESIPGSGIRARWKDSLVQAGNPYWLNIEDRPEIAALIDRGMTLFCVTLDNKLLAAFGLRSSLRDEAYAVIANLHRRNIKCHIVSGDNPKMVEDVASTLGIPLSNTAARRSPGDKQEYVKALMSSGRVVLFCGDGTNDAVAVAQADVGVQIGTTSDVTRATADVVLFNGLEGVTALLDTSRRCFRRIMFNFFWSALYNLFAILLAGGAFVRVRIPPAYAGLGEIVSVFPVIAVALSLLWTR
ncbi:P-type cation-transporting ATPase [Fonsecaea pedrosoi]|nr:P-type cation-transporting ATPase [Fonsecaea pedrosoi]